MLFFGMLVADQGIVDNILADRMIVVLWIRYPSVAAVDLYILTDPRPSSPQGIIWLTISAIDVALNLFSSLTASAKRL